MARNISTILRIKNMVCDRCIRVVSEELASLGLKVQFVRLGEAQVEGTVAGGKLSAVKEALRRNGFELLDDRRVQEVERIKQAVIRYVRSMDANVRPPERFPAFLSRELQSDYHTLASLFSSLENITLEHFVILQKIERVKELLTYDEKSLSEISYMLGYSSVAHLSAQFKSVSGFTPTSFRRTRLHRRLPLDKVR